METIEQPSNQHTLIINAFARPPFTDDSWSVPFSENMMQLKVDWGGLSREISNVLTSVYYSYSGHQRVGVVVGVDVLQRYLLSPVEMDWRRFVHRGLESLGCPVQLLGWAQGITVYLLGDQ